MHYRDLSKFIRQVLDMDPLPKIKHPTGAWKFPRKRRRSNTDAEGETPNGELKLLTGILKITIGKYPK